MITDRYLYDYKPLKDRVGEIIGKREEKMRAMEEEGRPGFNPKIDKYVRGRLFRVLLLRR